MATHNVNPSTANASSTASSTGKTATPPPAPTSLTRMLVLLGLLVLVVGAYAFDFFVAQPKAKAADDKIQEFVDERNKKGVRDAEPVTPQDISELLGMKPTIVEKHADENYEIEYYCWWGPVPVFNTRRQFIAVVYYGINEPRRFSSHHRNEKPPEEALPIPQQPGKAGEGETLATPDNLSGEAPAEAAAPAEEGKGPKEPAPGEPAPAEPTAKDPPSDKAAPAEKAPPAEKDAAPKEP